MTVTRVTFEDQKGVTEWIEITDGIVTAVSHPNLAAHYLGMQVVGAISEKQNLQLVTPDGKRNVAVASPIKNQAKKS